VLREGWPPWKAGLYDLEVVSPWGHYSGQVDLHMIGVQTSCLSSSYNIHRGIAQESDLCVQFVHHL